MKKLTFQNQVLLGISGIGLGHLLSWMTFNRIFENLGWIFYGLLFLLHPVWPERASQNSRMKTWVRLAGVLIIVMGCLIRSGTGGDFWHFRITEVLGVDVARGTVVESFDDHSGFHGDGTRYAVLSFEDDELEQVISAPGGWHVLPLTENLQVLVYGTATETTATGPFIGTVIPEVKSGYYYFYDRQGDTSEDAQVLTRPSFNYTIAIYDADADRLFYCEYDT